jgi:PAS domain S-box-containing protein
VTKPLARLLVVDDDRGIRRTVADVLRLKGYEIESAGRGGEALAVARVEQLRQRPFDVAILDIKLPRLSGLELLDALRAISPHTEVIFITAYASVATAVQALNRGAFAYLVKPFEMDELLATVEKALEARTLRETARLRAEEALRRSEERYRTLVEIARDVIFTLSLDGVFTSLNPVFEALTGWSRDQWLGKPFAGLVHPEDAPRAAELLQAFVSGERLPVLQLRILTQSGDYRIGEISASLRTEDGIPVGVLGIARDVTERKRSEEALHQLNEMQENVAKRIAHALHDEAGQVLASVYLAVAEVARDLPSPARERLGRIWQLLDQVDGHLRRLSHELRPTILDDLGLLPAIEFLAEGVSKRTGLAISVKGSTEGRLSPVSETSLYRTVQEALTNVVRHARASQVVIQLHRDRRTFRCSVQDDGVGFDPDLEAARRGDRGLGLIGIRERLKALGGQLRINAAPGRGTELVMTLPVGD